MKIRGSRPAMENADSCLPCTPEEEKRIISELTEAAESNLKEGNLYFLVANRWWRDWQEYIREDQSSCSIDELAGSSHQSNGYIPNLRQRPGRIDNSDLLLNGMEGDGNELELRAQLEEAHDYVLVSQEVWKKLHEWYSGGPAIPRKLICGGSFVRKEFSVEVYPLLLYLIDARNGHQSNIRISRKASTSELYSRVCTSLKLEQEKVRIWDYFGKRKHALLGESNRTLEEAQLQMNQHILLEVEVDGFWPSGHGSDSTGNGLALVPIEPSRSSTTIAGGPALSNGYSTGFGTDLVNGGASVMGYTEDGREAVNMNIKRDGGGLAGLQNLGNTCFMNSALQCLVHTPQLVEYFLQDYSGEINRSNPLGLKGELALAFGELLRKLWLPGRIPIAPRAFKGKLARFAPQFSGYNQHDSQELLAFLLDGLHEDLNRVKEKPYIEARDANGRPDEEFADECWRNHKARNDSIIVDVCQGQYKSTLVCPVCSKVSVTFDPFMYLSLPLPPTAKRTMTVTVFHGDGSSLPMPFTVNVPKHGCYRDLKQALSSECCLRSDESILLAEVYAHRIHQYLDNPLEPLSRIKDEDHIVAYRLPANHEKLPRLEIVHGKRQRCTSDLQNGGYQELLGTPLVTCLGEGPLTEADIQAAVRCGLAPLLRRKEYQSQNHAKGSKENGCGAAADSGSNIENHDPSTIPNMEIDQSPCENLAFHIWLTDARALNRNLIESGAQIRPDPIVRILLGWSNEEFDLYDFNFLENLPEVLKSGFTMKKTRQEAISLFSCLEAFLKEEPLGPDDMWYCPSCREHRQATKKLDLWKLPEILVVHLKRFSYSRYMKNKLDTFVSFPINNLDLSKYVKHKDGTAQSHMYELYAVSNHYGGLGGGHYSAYAKLTHENRWYHFDDSNVSAVGDESIKTSAAYVLFYRRVKAGLGAAEPSGSSSPSI